MSVTEIITPQADGRNGRGQFLPGHSGFGGGRPKGSRVKVTETVYRIGAEHFEENAKEAFDRLFAEDVATYCRVMVALATKEDTTRATTPFDSMAREELTDFVQRLEEAKRLAQSNPEIARLMLEALPAKTE